MKYLGRRPGVFHQAVYTCVQERTAAPSSAEHLAVLSSRQQDHRHRQGFNRAESGDGQVGIEDFIFRSILMAPLPWAPPQTHSEGCQAWQTFFSFLFVVMESGFLGIYLHCNQNTCFEIFSFIWVGCKSLLFFLCF